MSYPVSYDDALAQAEKYGQYEGQYYAADNKGTHFELIDIVQSPYGGYWKWKVKYLDKGRTGYWFPETLMNSATLIGCSPLAAVELLDRPFVSGMRFLKIGSGKNQGAIYTLRSANKHNKDLWCYVGNNNGHTVKGLVRVKTLVRSTKFVYMGIDPSYNESKRSTIKVPPFQIADPWHDDIQDAFSLSHWGGTIRSNEEPLLNLDLTNTKEKTMVNFEQYTVTKIRGVDAKELSDERILHIMEELQKDIDTAESLKVQSNTNTKRVLDMKKTLSDITLYLDGRNEDEDEK